MVEMVIEHGEQARGRDAILAGEPRFGRFHGRRGPGRDSGEGIGGNILQAVGPHRRMDGRHQQRGGNSLAAYVPESKEQLVGTERQEIIVVAADGASGAAYAVQFQSLKSLDLRQSAGK